MAELVIGGSEVEAGWYRCTACSYRLYVDGREPISACPNCGLGRWERDAEELSPSGG